MVKKWMMIMPPRKCHCNSQHLFITRWKFTWTVESHHLFLLARMNACTNLPPWGFVWEEGKCEKRDENGRLENKNLALHSPPSLSLCPATKQTIEELFLILQPLGAPTLQGKRTNWKPPRLLIFFQGLANRQIPMVSDRIETRWWQKQ